MSCTGAPMKTTAEIIVIVADVLNAPDKVVEFLNDLPWETIAEAYQAMLSAGERPGRAADKIAKALDQVVDFRKLAPGVAGQMLEVADGPAIRLALVLVLRFG